MDQSNAAAAADQSNVRAASAGSGRNALEPAGGELGRQEEIDEGGMTPFLQAIRTGTPEVVARVIETQGDSILGDCANNGMTCLHLAAERTDNSSAALVRLLLDGHHGRPELPLVDAQDKQSFTPLHVVSPLAHLAENKKQQQLLPPPPTTTNLVDTHQNLGKRERHTSTPTTPTTPTPHAFFLLHDGRIAWLLTSSSVLVYYNSS